MSGDLAADGAMRAEIGTIDNARWIGDRRVQIGELRIDLVAHTVYRGQLPLTLTNLEWKVLAYFIAHHGRFLAHQQILDDVWAGTYDRSSLYVIIGRLRKKLGCEVICTVRHGGYRFVSLADSPQPLERAVGSQQQIEMTPEQALHLALDPRQRWRVVQIIVTEAE